MPGFFIQKGIKLKDHFRKERKKQRELQVKYQLSSYLNLLIAEMVCKL
ncbi:hypothetical protein [Legionella israelensis]|nr:hypothetical protein [Legionella israelensis]